MVNNIWIVSKCYFHWLLYINVLFFFFNSSRDVKQNTNFFLCIYIYIYMGVLFPRIFSKPPGLKKIKNRYRIKLNDLFSLTMSITARNSVFFVDNVENAQNLSRVADGSHVYVHLYARA
jgi:hypothetical protein